jgi:hypothetical protein
VPSLVADSRSDEAPLEVEEASVTEVDVGAVATVGSTS